jgi:hypothetical protein
MRGNFAGDRTREPIPALRRVFQSEPAVPQRHRLGVARSTAILAHVGSN